jgi:hypothetical protein
MIGVNGNGEAGTLRVFVSNGQRSAEEWAGIALLKILHVAETAHPVIRDQANEFRDRIRRVVAGAIRSAIEEDRAYRGK